MLKPTDETRITLFIRKVNDLAYRSQQDAVLVALGFVYIILYDVLEAFVGAFGQGKSLIQTIRDREIKP